MFKFLLNFNLKNPQRGFTLIELLVTIVIVVILSSLALPSLLKQSLKAREAAAKSLIGSVNRAQQAYRLGKKTFANDIIALGIGVPLNTDEYNFGFGTTNATIAEFTAAPRNNDLSAFTGCTNAIIAAGHDANTYTNIKEQPANSGSPAIPPSC